MNRFLRMSVLFNNIVATMLYGPVIWDVFIVTPGLCTWQISYGNKYINVEV